MSSPEEFDLWESLEREWLKLPLVVMQDVGPAVQTLGGLLKLTAKETFRQSGEIAKNARLPISSQGPWCAPGRGAEPPEGIPVDHHEVHLDACQAGPDADRHGDG